MRECNNPIKCLVGSFSIRLMKLMLLLLLPLLFKSSYVVLWVLLMPFFFLFKKCLNLLIAERSVFENSFMSKLESSAFKIKLFWMNFTTCTGVLS